MMNKKKQIINGISVGILIWLCGAIPMIIKYGI